MVEDEEPAEALLSLEVSLEPPIPRRERVVCWRAVERRLDGIGQSTVAADIRETTEEHGHVRLDPREQLREIVPEGIVRFAPVAVEAQLADHHRRV